MRDFARAVVLVLAFLLLVAEVQRDDSVEQFNNSEWSTQ